MIWQWNNKPMSLENMSLSQLKEIKDYVFTNNIRFHYGIHRSKWLEALTSVIKYKELEHSAESILSWFSNSRLLRSEGNKSNYIKITKTNYVDREKLVEELKDNKMIDVKVKPIKDWDCRVDNVNGSLVKINNMEN